MKKIIKLIVSSVIVFSVLSIPVKTLASDSMDDVKISSEGGTVNRLVDQKMVKSAKKLEDLFDKSSSGNLHLEIFIWKSSSGNLLLDIKAETLSKELSVTIADAEIMIDISKQINMEEIRDSKTRGFVGIHFKLGPKVRKMSSWAAGVYASGYVSWHLKQFIKNPATAGVAAVIAGSVGVTVGWAVKNKLKKVSVGVRLPFVSMSYTVSIP